MHEPVQLGAAPQSLLAGPAHHRGELLVGLASGASCMPAPAFNRSLCSHCCPSWRRKPSPAPPSCRKCTGPSVTVGWPACRWPFCLVRDASPSTRLPTPPSLRQPTVGGLGDAGQDSADVRLGGSAAPFQNLVADSRLKWGEVPACMRADLDLGSSPERGEANVRVGPWWRLPSKLWSGPMRYSRSSASRCCGSNHGHSAGASACPPRPWPAGGPPPVLQPSPVPGSFLKSLSALDLPSEAGGRRQMPVAVGALRCCNLRGRRSPNKKCGLRRRWGRGATPGRLRPGATAVLPGGAAPVGGLLRAAAPALRPLRNAGGRGRRAAGPSA